MRVAEELAGISRRTGVPVIFKSSFLKDNRSSEQSFQGPGLDEGLRILEDVRASTGLPVLSDIHDLSDVKPAAQVLDVLQIPAYLCQQTRLTLAAARTGLPLNVKKGQFMAPEDMAATLGKIRRAGNDRVFLTERGSSFGYRTLVVDMRSIPKMQALGVPVVMDATHAVRRQRLRLLAGSAARMPRVCHQRLLLSEPRAPSPRIRAIIRRSACLASSNALTWRRRLGNLHITVIRRLPHEVSRRAPQSRPGRSGQPHTPGNAAAASATRACGGATGCQVAGESPGGLQALAGPRAGRPGDA
jgi:3-deoxy-8-phosphooctulonate synthase